MKILLLFEANMRPCMQPTVELWTSWDAAVEVESSMIPRGNAGLWHCAAECGFTEVESTDEWPRYVAESSTGEVLIDASRFLSAIAEQRGLAGTRLAFDQLADVVVRHAGQPTIISASLDLIHEGGRAFLDAITERLGSLSNARSELALHLAWSDASPLVGLHGAGSTLAARREAAGIAADAHAIQAMDKEIAAYAYDIENSASVRNLLGGGIRRFSKEPGSGVGGGLGFALLALNARSSSAVAWAAHRVNLDAQIAGADLVVAVMERLDAAATSESVVTAASPYVLEHAVPLVVVTCEEDISRLTRASLGISGVHLMKSASCDGSVVTNTMRRVAQTWVPRGFPIS